MKTINLLAASLCFGAVSLSADQLKIVYGNNASAVPNLEKFDISTGLTLDTFYPKPSGNGRGVVVVGNVVYSTFVSDSNIYKNDATTGASLGFIPTPVASMSTLAWDGSGFWTTDYSGSNRGFRLNFDGTLDKTVSFSQSFAYMDGMEYFNGKLIVNRADAEGPYSIYDTDGNLLTANFITPTFQSTGIAYDGVNFLVSNIFGSALAVYDGTTGAFIENIALTSPNSNTGYGRLVEDLSVNYAERPDTGGPQAPEASTSLAGLGLALMVGGRMYARRRQAKNA